MFKVVVGTQSLNVSQSSGLVSGPIHVNLDGLAFPDPTWWDFPCVVLSWWLQATQGQVPLLFDLRFMDGPALLRCSADGEDLAVRAIFERSIGAETQREARIPAEELREEIQRAATVLVQACRQRDLPCDELDRLIA
jgi:hypothetical protein